MTELDVRDLVKIYPFTKPGLFDKRGKAALKKQMESPYTTNEGVIAVQQLSFTADHGDFVVILGPSGCGKSTLLRMIAGLTNCDLGRVYLDGKDITDLRPEERDLSMIFQNYSLYPHLSVFDNIAFTLKNQHMPRQEIEVKVKKVAEALSLSDKLDRRISELSGGEQQRVAIGRAIIREPKLFLMDEPFSNLDISLRRQMRKVITELHERLGTTFLYVTHDQTEAMAMADKVLLMRHGMIEQAGTPRELYHHPANLYVATFIGAPSMNLDRSAQAEKTKNGWKLQAFGKEYLLPAERITRISSEKAAASGQDIPVIAGIRPAHVGLSLTKALPGGSDVPGEVIRVEHLGSEMHITMRLRDEERSEVTAAIPSAVGSRYMKGLEVSVSIPGDKLHLFDPETEENLA